MLPHAGDPPVQDAGTIAAATARMMAGPVQPQSILFANDGFGLDRLSFAKGAGAYADQSGTIVTRWASQWERPELWIFDFHHHLFAGDTGEVVIGVAALCGLFFVISGAILWWRTRKTYEFRLLPRRLSRPAIVRHHRDLGIVMAPLLALSLYTGAVMIFRPVSMLLFGPGAPAAIAKASKPPKVESAQPARVAPIDFAAIVRISYARFPEASLRFISMPRKDGPPLIAVRMRQPEEWLPNGRTMLWFSAADGHFVEARDARGFDWRVKGYNLLYPLHGAKVGGLAWRLVMTLSGLALTLLGSLAVWSFWFGKQRRPR